MKNQIKNLFKTCEGWGGGGKSDWRILFISKDSITNRVTNVRLHSLSQIFKGRTEVRVDIPAPHHNVISGKKKKKRKKRKRKRKRNKTKANNVINGLLCPD